MGKGHLEPPPTDTLSHRIPVLALGDDAPVYDNAYELIDAGDGRRLERFGDMIVDRPAPMADQPIRDPSAWARADLKFRRYAGWESIADTEPGPWLVRHGELTFELRPTETGQVGLFPEQASNWAWLRGALHGEEPFSVMNLFAYTGAATLAAAASGASVTHVDGSRPTVAWARRNAELSGLAAAPIRWIVDDVEAFVARELRRDRRYDAVILDPPSYGHGRGGRAWRLEDRLGELLDTCAAATNGDPAFALLTAHTPGFDAGRLGEELARSFHRRPSQVQTGDLELRAKSGAHLRLGAFARIIRG
jgi:23S rRNA (cytosine1962-C5)-methyltransferase